MRQDKVEAEQDEICDPARDPVTKYIREQISKRISSLHPVYWQDIVMSSQQSQVFYILQESIL